MPEALHAAPLAAREFSLTVNDVARMLRTYADSKATEFGMTQALSAVLVRLDRLEGLKQSKIAEMLELRPISLTRLLDRLCDRGLIERRPDSSDRRAKQLFLTPTARLLLVHLGSLDEELMRTALNAVERESVEEIVVQLAIVKKNLRQAIQQRTADGTRRERRHG
jgi:MarR family transcriptional regulator, transcriptional regulator for hemolysin